MSIKDFHIIFIISALILTFGFGVWALNNNGMPATPGLRLTAGVSFLLAAGLGFYCVHFIRKIKTKV